MRSYVSAVMLPSEDDAIAPVRILDADGQVVRVVPAAEFRQTHPLSEERRRWSHSPRTGGRATR
jgi:hypothetical protein